MDDAILDLRIELLMLRMVTASAWANILVNSGGDPLADCRHLATRMAEALRASSDVAPGSGELDVLDLVLEKVDAFWTIVEEQLVDDDMEQPDAV